jgi:hypothetical protein
MTNTNSIQAGTAVVTWDGTKGTVLYLRNGWYAIRDEAGLISEWQPSQVEAA